MLQEPMQYLQSIDALENRTLAITMLLIFLPLLIVSQRYQKNLLSSVVIRQVRMFRALNVS